MTGMLFSTVSAIERADLHASVLAKRTSFMEDAFHRENHFVPRMYLKPWELPDGKIWTYRILVPHKNVPLWKRASKKAVAWHSHLYTQMVAGQETDDVERWFDHEFENPAEEPLHKATSDKRLTPNDWERLIRFTAAQDVRTPAWFAQQLKRLDKTLPQLMKQSMENSINRYEEAARTGEPMAQAPQLPAAEREGLPLRTIVKRSPSGGGEIGAEIVIGRQYWLWSIKRLVTITMKVLHQHRWTILKPPEGTAWFTSDNPVIRLNFYTQEKYDFNGGWNSPGTEILMPLGPQHLLYHQVGRPTPQRGERMSDDQACLVRRITAEHAWRMVFSHAEDDEVPSLRPRVVDADAVKDERRQWDNWHDQQMAAEKVNE
jgi:hypothetical protein